MSLWLCVLHINDAYELHNFPSFYSLVQEKSSKEEQGGPDRCLVVLAGDFLGPSLLSSLDKGVGMVDILNRVGVTHVCFGNHESNIPMESLTKRISEQSKFVWVNSNMQDLDKKLGVKTTEYDIVVVENANGESKKVAVLGLMTNQETLYPAGAFADAVIDPIIAAKERLEEKLRDDVDLFLPLTHQLMEEDRIFAEHFGGPKFPIIVGGHDHNVFDEVVNGSQIVKTGHDAENTNIIDIKWNTAGQSKPTVSVEMVPTSSFPVDLDIQAKVKGHWQIIKELEKAKLFHIHKWAEGDEFSTKNNRLGPTQGSTALVTMLRMGLQAQCCILNAGSIRGNSTYEPNTFFTWSDLKGEIPFPTLMLNVWVPGKVIEATINHSRRYSRTDPPTAHGSFLHTCNNIAYNNETQMIDKIMGAPMLSNQLYLIGMDVQFLSGLDNHAPLLEWLAANPVHWDEEAARPAKLVLVKLFSALLWLYLGSFEDLDLDGDGFLTQDEVQASMFKHYGESSIADLVVDNVFAIADTSGDGVICPMEMMIVHLMATDLVSPQSIGNDDNQLREAMEATVAHVLNKEDLTNH